MVRSSTNGPASRTTTERPAVARSAATTPPPAPEPTITTSASSTASPFASGMTANGVIAVGFLVTGGRSGTYPMAVQRGFVPPSPGSAYARNVSICRSAVKAERRRASGEFAQPSR
jgi:hypothetical protein